MLITYTGRMFDPLEPTEADICIMDIAHALANTCRFNGHCSEFYSVAQHSFLVSKALPAKEALWGLLHDAAEAYIGDIIRPIKALPQMAGMEFVEAKIAKCIADKFNTRLYNVSRVDDGVLLDEMKALRLYWHDFLPGVKSLGATILPCWTPKQAESNFLCRFDELYCGAVSA